MMKRCRRNIYKRVVASLLASVVLLTSSQWFPVQAKNNPNTQTGYDSLIEFQVERWNGILESVFGDTIKKTSVSGNTASIPIPSRADIENGTDAVVQEGNSYFNWETEKTANLGKWSGDKGEVALADIDTREETIVYAEDSAENAGDGITAPETTVIYRVYDVYNADQLYCVMSAVRNLNYNVKINLCADIDLNGKEQIWYSSNVNPECNGKNYWYYIEGNGYTIYNMKTRSAGDYTASFLGDLNQINGSFTSKKFVLKNLNFSNCLVFGSTAGTAVVISMNKCRLYMENVNVSDSFLYSGHQNVGGILGRNQCTTGAMFMRNCSTSGLYAFGTNHSGGFSGTFYNTSGDIKFPVRYNAAFPVSPESWMAKTEYTFPLMVENCYSVDSELFSVGTEGDSGAFISCGAKFICRNSFTNNIIYGATNTGAFIGRIVTVDSGKQGMQDDKGDSTVATYFENCFAFGSVEGRDKIGGFAGYDSGSANGESGRGITVYKNCYTTAMAGMDYSGRQVGGFIGHESTRLNQKASIAVGTDESGATIYTTEPGDVYINCYAAGEVGNILTETDVKHNCQTDESEAQGGFLGAVGFWGFDYNNGAGDQSGVKKAQEGESNGNYINCYYDMQTTGMRERASGKSWSFADRGASPSQIPGVTGVYTQYSDAKEVIGLAYSSANQSMSVNMGDNEVWMYRDGYYPALVRFNGDHASEYFGKLKESGTITSIAEVTYLDEETAAALEAGLLPDGTEDPAVGEITDLDGDGIPDGTETTDGTEDTEAAGDKTEAGTEAGNDTEAAEDPDSAEAGAGTEAAGETDKDNVGTSDGADNGGDAGSTDGAESTGAAGDTETSEPTDSTEASENAGDTGAAEETEDTEDAGSVQSVENTEDAESVQSVDGGDGAVITGSTSHTKKAASVVKTVGAAKTVSAVRTVGTAKAARAASMVSTAGTVGAGSTDAGEAAGSTDGKDTAGASGSVDDKDTAGATGSTDDKDTAGTTGNTDDKDTVGTTGSTDDKDTSGTAGNTDDKGTSGTAGSTDDKDTAGTTDSTDDKDTAGTTGSVDNKDATGTTDSIDSTDPAGGTETTEDTTLPGTIENMETPEDGIQLFMVGEGEPVSLTYDEETKERIQKKLNEKAALVPVYLQASVSTVFLNHWDSAMNMDTGSLGGETDWAPGLPANQLTQKEYKEDDPYRWEQDTDGKYWEISYKNLAANANGYELKVQAGDSWTYNFGSDKFGGDNCRLEVPKDCDVKVKFDYTSPASITGENTSFRIWAEFYDDLYDEDGNEKEDAVPFDKQELGHNTREDETSTWTVVGSLPGSNWDKTNTAFDMNYLGTGHRNGDYELVKTLPAGTYSFQITRNHSWDECYGLSGNNGREKNMTFTLARECEVSILFNENTHLTSVETNPADALTACQTMEAEVEFEGYSVISSTAITGHDWLDSLKAAQDGAMTDTDGDGVYEKSFTVTGKANFDTIHGYKVITDGQDAGNRIYFHLDGPGVDADESEYTRTLTFYYNPETGETWVSDNKDEDDSWIENDPTVDSWNVLGSTELTGYSWDEGMTAEEKEKMSRGKMEQADGTGDGEGTDYFINYQKVPAGTHSFKVVANGSFDSGIEYGSYDGNNYLFTTSETATINIHFNSRTKEITVATVPDHVMVESDYVVVGIQSLTGSNWDASDENNRMGYQGGYKDTYTKKYTVKSGDRCTFKVAHFGTDDSTEPVSVVVDGVEGEEYTLEIIYHARNASTEYHLYDEDGNNVTPLLKDPQYEFWSVLGDRGLTGCNWEESEGENTAADVGKMEWNEEAGVYTKTFANVAVGSTPQLLNFKVAAEGSWDTGISYGGRLGNNYTIVLASNEVTACSVIITFDPKTHQINVTASPDCLQTGAIDESVLVWYVAGDYDLVSEDAYYTASTVYDTVRDITSAFTFTSGTNVDWDYDNARNSASGFFPRIGTTEEGTGFSLYYTVEDKEITGTFNELVITLEKDAEGNSYCERFMPGKQWVKVTTGDDAGTRGSRSIRLIPTAYLEAGNDANIYVLQSESDTRLENVENTVVYQKNNLSEITFTGLEGENFKRYNAALTAAYAISDRVGFGYYGNYSKQNVVTYKADGDDGIRPNMLDTSLSETYFVMSSAFTKAAAYHDKKNFQENEKTNLVVDALVDQNLIGSSYGTDEDQTKAKTIIKVSRLDGKGGSTKVFTTRNVSDGAEKDRAKTTYEKNYLKWTGQMPFDSADAGTYEVTFYWSLSDGRYLSDSKQVTIYSGLAFIEKTVDKNYFEIKDSREGKSVTLKYEVTYNNPVRGDFAIVDVLPFDGDIRKDSSREDGTNSSSVGESTILKLKSVEVSSSGADVTGLNASYTEDTGVRKYVDRSTLNDGAADEVLGAKVTWNPAGSSMDANAAAIRVTGTQTKDGGSSEITLKYTIEVRDAERGDHYVNNAFFTVTRYDGTIHTEGVSNPVVTGAVGRELSGYVWIDSDLDGRYDDAEPAVDGVKVTLQKLIDGTEDSWENVAYTTSQLHHGEHGYYEFADICPGGEYRVIFQAPESGKVAVYKANGDLLNGEVAFGSLNLTRRLSRYQVEEKRLSRNIADYLDQSEKPDPAKGYFIDEELPSAREIYDNNTLPHFREGKVVDYYFTRLYQNLGLTELKDVGDKKSSLTIQKREGTLDGDPIPDVKFKLEYSLDGSEEGYVPVSYCVRTDPATGKTAYVFLTPEEKKAMEEAGNGDKVLEANEVLTDADGRFRFINLPTADYRLTEVEPAEGYNPLGAPVEFTLPYVERESDKDEYIEGEGTGDQSTLEPDVKYYYDITYTITNSKPLHMPLTGHLRELLPLILAGILFMGSVGLYTGYRIKKRRF